MSLRLFCLVAAAMLLAASCDEGRRPVSGTREAGGSGPTQEATAIPAPLSPTPAPTATPAPRLLDPSLFPLPLFQDEIAVINADGTGRRTLATTDEQVDSRMSWFPDGRLAFGTQLSMVEGNRFVRKGRLYAVDPAGGAPQLLYEGEGSASASWSADGVWAFVRFFPSRTTQKAQAFIIRPDTGERYDLAGGGGGRWLPDGSLMYIGPPDSEQKLLRLYPGGQPQPVFPQHTFLQESGWAGFQPNPDFSFLLVYSQDGSKRVVDMETGEITEVPGSVGAQVSGWLPSGHTLLVKTGGLYPSEPESQIWLFDALKKDSSLLLMAPSIASFDVLPDGRHFIYSRAFGEEIGLYLFDMETGESARVITADRATGVKVLLGGRLLMLAHTCIACDAGPFPFSLIGYGWVQRFGPNWSGPVDLTRESVVWGGAELVRVNTDGSSVVLDAVPESAYMSVLPDEDRGLAAFFRNTSSPAKAFEVNVVTGEFAEVAAPPRPDRPPPTPTPPASFPYVPVPRSSCGSPDYTERPLVSPGGDFALVKTLCDGLYLVELSSGAGVILSRPGLCLLGRNTYLEWLDNVRLRLVTYHGCL